VRARVVRAQALKASHLPHLTSFFKFQLINTIGLLPDWLLLVTPITILTILKHLSTFRYFIYTILEIIKSNKKDNNKSFFTKIQEIIKKNKK
jgi:hypothetical protein